MTVKCAEPMLHCKGTSADMRLCLLVLWRASCACGGLRMCLDVKHKQEGSRELC
jgi:hypothetical protein